MVSVTALRPRYRDLVLQNLLATTQSELFWPGANSRLVKILPDTRLTNHDVFDTSVACVLAQHYEVDRQTIEMCDAQSFIPVTTAEAVIARAGEQLKSYRSDGDWQLRSLTVIRSSFLRRSSAK